MVEFCHSGVMTVTDGQDQYKQVPPSQAPKLVPWSEDANYLSPGGYVEGISAFAESANSPSRSTGSKIFIRVVVGILLVSIIFASVWRLGG